MREFILDILIFTGSLGLFLYGMRRMSDAQQKLAGNRMRRVMKTMNSNAFRRIVSGSFITAVIQSSGAITVMVVGFVSAGLLTLTQSIGIIMGANIGTTVTSWLISVPGFQFDMGISAIAFVAVGFPLTILRNERLRSAGNILIGFSIILLSVHVMRTAAGELVRGGALPSPMQGVGGHTPIPGFFAAGLLLTLLLQSSSASITLTMIMCANGWITFECGAAMILGGNVGTTATANIAAMRTNTNARRAALVHTLFNVTGVLWALPLISPLTRLTAAAISLPGWGSPLEESANTPLALALFHTLFNVLNTVLLAGFIPLMGKLVSALIRSNGDGEHRDSLRYFGSGIMSAGEVTILHAHKEVTAYARDVSSMFSEVVSLFREHNADNFNAIYAAVEKREDASDATREKLYDFLGRAAKENLGVESMHKIEIMFRLVSEIEIMSDQNYSIAKVLRTKKELNIWFEPELRDGVNAMFSHTMEAMEVMNCNLEATFGDKRPSADVGGMKSGFYDFHTRLKEECLHSGAQEESRRKAELIFSDLVTRIEQLADIVTDISENAVQLTSRYGR